MRLSKSTVHALREFWGHHLKKKTLQHWATRFKRNEDIVLPQVEHLVPPKGRIRSPMPVRMAKQRGFLIARRIQQRKRERMEHTMKFLTWDQIALSLIHI